VAVGAMVAVEVFVGDGGAGDGVAVLLVTAVPVAETAERVAAVGAAIAASCSSPAQATPPKTIKSKTKPRQRCVIFIRYQGCGVGPIVNSFTFVSSGWSIANATTLATRSGEMPYRSYRPAIASAAPSWEIVPSSSVLMAAG